MHPQYMPQQYSGIPSGGFGQGGQPGASSRPSPSVTPGSYQQPPTSQGGPIQRMDSGTVGFLQSDGRATRIQGSPNTGVANGPSVTAPPVSQGGYPQHSRNLQTMHQASDLSTSNHLVGQMSGMNINGPPRPSSQSVDYSGNRTAKHGPTIQSYGDTQPAVNGVMSPSHEQFQNGLLNQTPPWPSRGPLVPTSQPSTPGGDNAFSKLPGQYQTSQQVMGLSHQVKGASQQAGGLPQVGGPPQQVEGPPQKIGGLPQHVGGPPQQMGGLPQHMGGPPQQMGGPPQQMGGPPQQMGGPPQQMGGPPQQMGGVKQQIRVPPSQIGGPPQQLGGPPSHMGGPQSTVGPPSTMGGPPHPMGGPPPTMGGPPPAMGGPPPAMGGPPPTMGGPPPTMGGPPPTMGGPPPTMGGPPPTMGGPPPQQYLSGSSYSVGGPPGMSGPLQMGATPLINQQQQMGNTHLYQQGPSVGKGYPQMHDMYNANAGGQPPSYQPLGTGGYPAGSQQPTPQGLQSQPTRRLDPDQMPSPIQVMLDDQRNRSGIFYTNQKGLVPPLVTTNFTVQDQGNASPRFIRSTMYSVPATMDMMKQTAVPFGLVISPLAEEESPPPIVNTGDLGPVRCNRCKAYMCPFMQFIDGGRRFHCLFCKAATEVPSEYFQHLDHTGQRVDRYERPELVLGTYEFVATKDYCRNNTFPNPPAVVFLIDVSYNNMKSGMVKLLCSRMKEIIRLLPKEVGAERSNMRVGFITYNNTVHFYNVKSVLAQPQMMVVGDLQDMFMPLLEGFLCDPYESEAVIDSLMEQIPLMFADTRETETILAPAIQAGLEALKASECSGKLLVFHSSLPIAEAPGKLKNRDDRKLLGTEKEKTVLAPQVNTYNHLGQECVGVGCSVDLFIFNNSYIDLATIGQVCRLTGGEIFKYTYFQSDLDGERFIEDLTNNISRPVAFDAIMRVRTSTGVRATDFYGHFYMQNTTDMELCSIDCNKAVAIEVKHDDKLTEEEGVYVQVALLYTSCSGQRRLRIINLSLKTCVQMADLYRSCDLDTIINFFSKQAVFRLLESPPKTVKDSLVNRCAIMLACYRKNCASPSSAGQLILPECMKLLPLYINCVLKSDALSGGSDITIDDRWFVMQAVSIMDVPSSVAYFYPRLLPLHDVDINSDEIPAPIRCSSDKLSDDGVYLLENGINMFIWIALNVDVEWVQNVFGVHSAAQIDIDKTELPNLDNALSVHIRNLVQMIRDQRHRSMRLILVRQRDKLEVVFKHFLMEDRGLDGSPSYVDFLCHMHKEIRSLLS